MDNSPIDMKSDAARLRGWIGKLLAARRIDQRITGPKRAVTGTRQVDFRDKQLCE
jgi:hypothetical protein